MRRNPHGALKAALVSLLILCCVLAFSVRAAAQLSPLDKPSYYPPHLYSVTADPAAPTASKDITIKAEVYSDPGQTKNEVVLAAINFSSNGGKTWETAEMDQDEGNKKRWTGVIPMQSPKAQVFYYVRAEDSGENAFVELPCKVTTWPPSADPCMVFAVYDKDPADDPSEIVPDFLDIKETAIGYDDKSFYVRQTLFAKASPGTLNPVNLNVYGARFFVSNSFQVENLYRDTARVIYTPLNTVYPCVLEYSKGDDTVPDRGKASCAMDGPNVFLRVDRAALRCAEKCILRIVPGFTAAAQSANFDTNDLKEYDLSMMVEVGLDSGRSFKVAP